MTVAIFTHLDQATHDKIEETGPLRCADPDDRKMIILKGGTYIGDGTWEHRVRYESEFDA